MSDPDDTTLNSVGRVLSEWATARPGPVHIPGRLNSMNIRLWGATLEPPSWMEIEAPGRWFKWARRMLNRNYMNIVTVVINGQMAVRFAFAETLRVLRGPTTALMIREPRQTSDDPPS